MTRQQLTEHRILIVDDQESNVRLLLRILEEAGYNHTFSSTDSRCTIELAREVEPDLILLDLSMPYLDGYTVLEQLNASVRQGQYLPVLVLTADITAAAKRRALSLGANDFLAKPFDLTEVLLRIQNLLDTRLLHQQLAESNQLLEHRVQERTAALENAKLEILQRLAFAGEYRDDATGEHTQRVGLLAAGIALSLGLPSADVELIRLAAPLHDIGKIGIPDSILLKPGPLTPDEFAMMRSHTTIGSEILSCSAFPIMQVAERIARTHHEKWDGSGYPNRLSGESIPIEGRIVALADVYDALCHPRPYKQAWPHEQVMGEIERQCGKHFDPQVVEAFRRGLSDSLWALQQAIGRSRSVNTPLGTALTT